MSAPRSRETCGKVLGLNAKMLKERQDKIVEKRIVVLGFLWSRREVKLQPREHTRILKSFISPSNVAGLR